MKKKGHNVRTSAVVSCMRNNAMAFVLAKTRCLVNDWVRASAGMDAGIKEKAKWGQTNDMGEMCALRDTATCGRENAGGEFPRG